MKTKLPAIIAVLLVAWATLFLAQKINFPTADLGRHITNGRIILQAPLSEKLAVLETNFYSHTFAESPFLNHHWASGVIFYLVWKVFGFVGLSVFSVVIVAIALLLFWHIARKESNVFIASSLALILLPLIVSRIEIRPEMFTYFFSGIFLWIIKSRVHWWYLPPIMLVWINVHIGFVFGFLILGAFIFDESIKKIRKQENNLHHMLIISAACAAAALINPFGYKAVIYPFEIFKNYGYRIVENQSIPFLERLDFTARQHFLLFKLTASGAAVSLFLAIVQKRTTDISGIALAASSGVIAYFGIRHFPSFALFTLPPFARLIYSLRPQKSDAVALLHIMCSAMVIIALGFQVYTAKQTWPVFGLGLRDGVNAAAEFFVTENLHGPIFNNYDIGGYLIYHLYPQEKVFVDNRPEAYTQNFFENIYVPAQENSNRWAELDRQYNFNVIFFSHLDFTPWGQKFLIERIDDPAWAPVFADQYAILFLKRIGKNEGLIKAYEIPRDKFKII